MAFASFVILGDSELIQAAVLAKGDATMRDDIVFLKKLPLFHIDEDGNYIEL